MVIDIRGCVVDVDIARGEVSMGEGRKGDGVG
jgi:hypothetical protein